jgi:chromosomal replication initiator protein
MVKGSKNLPVVVQPPQATLPVKVSQHKNRGYINTAYKFDSFIVGPSNSLARAAAQAVTEKPGTLYNPLFIYGDSGLGKTHLLHAIANQIKIYNPQAVVLYQTADRFVNEFINAIRFDKIHKFQEKYKDIDVLLVDDIQFISNKEQTQEAFFHIFNSLYDAHKQIVFSSDTFPQNMQGLAERLRSRLGCGLVTDIHTPTLETKIAILKKNAELSNEPLADDVAHFIAARVVSNIRELEGALVRIMAFSSLTKQPVSLELARKIMMRVPDTKSTAIDFACIIRSISKYYPFTLEDLRSKGRSKDLSAARQVAMFFMKKMTDRSLRDIGAYLGGRDHSTVMHALEKVERQGQQSAFRELLKKIEAEIKK